MKYTRNLTITILAILLIVTGAPAQRRNLVLRFRVPFPFIAASTTYAAGEYEVTQPGKFIVVLRNLQSQISAFEHVQPAGSGKDSERRAVAVFHRYGEVYFLASISDGSWQSSNDLKRSSQEERLTEKSPRRQPQILSVLSNGTIEIAQSGQ
jgi:hypothetical protein